MDAKRLIHTIMLWLIPSAQKRADYLRKHKVFRSIGKNVVYVPRNVPLYAELISIGNNSCIASNVKFNAHDGISTVLNNYSDNLTDESLKYNFTERLGCISIGDNVFVGAGCRLQYNIKIGNNVIIGAGSIVSRDIPDNSVVKGQPAKRVCSFEDYYRINAKEYFPKEFNHSMGRALSKELTDYLWTKFNESHNSRK